MNHPDYDFMIVTERRRDEMAAAEHARLVKEARAGRQAPSGTRGLGDALVLSLARFLSLAGGWLVSLGCRLQTHVAQLSEGMAETYPSPSAENA